VEVKPASRTTPVTPEEVLDTAIGIVEEHGLKALTMRRLASDLGVTTPSVYWHVGNREQLIDLMIDKLADDVGTVELVGADPAERIISVCLNLMRRVRDRPHLLALAAYRGSLDGIFGKIEKVLADEVLASGLDGEQAAFAFAAIGFSLGGFLLLEHAVPPGYQMRGLEGWREEVATRDAAMVAVLSAGIHVDSVSDYALATLVRSLVKGALAPEALLRPAMGGEGLRP
jgi:TetR/AcrR family tetracycline transcriptional repressor